MSVLLEKSPHAWTLKEKTRFFHFWREELEKLGAMQIMQWTVENFASRLVLETEFSMNALAIMEMLSRLDCELEVINRNDESRFAGKCDVILVDHSRDRVTGEKVPILRWNTERDLFLIALARWTDEMVQNKIIRDSFPCLHTNKQNRNLTSDEFDSRNIRFTSGGEK